MSTHLIRHLALLVPATALALVSSAAVGQGGGQVLILKAEGKPASAAQMDKAMRRASAIVALRAHAFGAKKVQVRLMDGARLELSGELHNRAALAPILTRVGKLEVRPLLNVQTSPNQAAKLRLEIKPGKGKPDLYQFVDSKTRRAVPLASVLKGAPPVLTQNDFKRTVTTGTNGANGTPFITIDLKGAAARHFAEHTRKRVGSLLAIVVDGSVYAAPMINEPITDGKLMISAHSLPDAQALATALNSGPLPVRLRLTK